MRLNIHIDDDTLRRLQHAARLIGRSVEDLAESAVSEAACNHARDNPAADKTRREEDQPGLKERIDRAKQRSQPWRATTPR